MRKALDFGNAATNCFDFEEALSFIASPTVKDQKGRKGLLASPVYITDPCQAGTSPLRTMTLLASGQIITGNLGTTALTLGGLIHFLQTGNSNVGLTSSNDPEWPLVTFGMRATSNAATAQILVLDIRECKKSLSVIVQYSGAATGTLTIESSVDGTNWIIIDVWPAANLITKFYSETTVGTTGAGFTPVSPLSFRRLRVTAASGGGADTSTVTIGVK